MSDDSRQTPRSRRRLLTLGLAAPLLLPLRAVQASAPIEKGKPSSRAAGKSTAGRTSASRATSSKAAASKAGSSTSQSASSARAGTTTSRRASSTTARSQESARSSSLRTRTSSARASAKGSSTGTQVASRSTPASSASNGSSGTASSTSARSPSSTGGLQRTAYSAAADQTQQKTAERGVAAVRMWPSREYTRVTLELTQSIPFRARMLDNPNRVILDLDGLQLESKIRDLVGRLSMQDPFVRQVRVGQFTPETLRIVFDLKQPVAPQVFTLKPTSGYQHRLVLDFYPKQANDTLDSLIASAAEAQKESKGSADSRQHARAGSGSSSGAAGAKQAPASDAVSRIFTVALDPGHGGEDPGATGPKGTHEKDVVLAVAHRVRKLLAGEKNLRVVMTRDDDYYVPLAKRVSKARGVRADLFVSIHADAFVKPDARGSSVFVLSNHGATSVGAKWLARNENRADLIGGVNIKMASMPETASLLMDLYTTSQIRDSKVLATRMLSELGQIGKLHRGHVEQANFAVLRSPDVPSVLVETAFISNPDEERRLRDPAYQDRLARAIARGILDYRRNNPPGPRGKVS